jgi:hypothetical protein
MSNILRRVKKAQAAQCANRARAFRRCRQWNWRSNLAAPQSLHVQRTVLSKHLTARSSGFTERRENKKDYVYFVLNKQDLRLAKIAIALLSERHQRRKQATTLYSLLEGLDQASAHSDGLICDIKE